MANTWYPAAKKDELANAGAMLTAHPWRGVLHTTEGSSYAGARGAYIKNRSAPHFTVSFEGGVFKVWQHVPIDRAARALRNKSGGAETNRLRCIQIEIVGSAARSGSFPGPYLDGLGKLMRWIESNTGIKKNAPRFYGSGEGIVLATESSPVRMSADQWNKFDGWCGHQHVPENTHWDPGKINIQHLLNVDIGVRPMYDPPIPIQMVDSHDDPEAGGAWVLDKNGGVITVGSARFWGSPVNKPYWQAREAARIRIPSEIPDYPQNTAYKYVITATTGENYGYPET